MKRIQRILFAIDFASNYETLIPWVRSFADQFNATLCLLYVLQEVPSFITVYASCIDTENFREKLKGAARKKMADIVEEFFQDYPKLETSVEFGTPAEKILEFTNRKEIDLIVMGSRGHTGIQRALLGSVATNVAQAASCPVVIIHP